MDCCPNICESSRRFNCGHVVCENFIHLCNKFNKEFKCPLCPIYDNNFVILNNILGDIWHTIQYSETRYNFNLKKQIIEPEGNFRFEQIQIAESTEKLFPHRKDELIDIKKKLKL